MTVKEVTAVAAMAAPPRAPADLARALETHFLTKLEYLNAIGIALSLQEGMLTLKMDGMEKVLQGITDMAQVRAVCIK